MSQVNIHTGVVGFFDILGYQNLLERNKPEDIAKKILPILTGLSSNVPIRMVEQFSKGLAKSKESQEMIDAAKHGVNSIQWLVFSDTILLALPIDTKNKLGDAFLWVTFFAACIHLQTLMFQEGLPTRGVINFGKFFLKDTCFAGKSIIEAYQLCKELELAACTLTEKASLEINKYERVVEKQIGKSIINLFFFNYLVPTKDGEMHLDTLATHYLVPPKNDIHSTVIESFWAHNKDISASVDPKVYNILKSG